jgi:hypothetical protein
MSPVSIHDLFWFKHLKRFRTRKRFKCGFFDEIVFDRAKGLFKYPKDYQVGPNDFVLFEVQEAKELSDWLHQPGNGHLAPDVHMFEAHGAEYHWHLTVHPTWRYGLVVSWPAPTEAIYFRCAFPRARQAAEYFDPAIALYKLERWGQSDPEGSPFEDGS